MWEANILQELLVLLARVNLSIEDDKWGWILEDSGGFMVKPAYALLEEMLVTKNRFSSMEEKVIKIYVEKSGTVKVNNIFLAISS